MLAIVLTSGLVLGTGCKHTPKGVVFVPEGSPIRIGPKTKGYVYTWNEATGKWILSDKRVPIPEGWYAVSLPPE
jgi:hypothetical protein